jgi:hypothetical protein
MGSIVGTFSPSRLLVKTIHHFGLHDGGMMRRHSIGGIVVELWYL